MLKTFLHERRSWILFYVLLMSLILFIAYLDVAIPFTPIVYMVFLSTTMFMIFLIVRYQKETKFYKSLQEWEENLEVESIGSSHSPFEKLTEAKLLSQIEHFKNRISQNQIALEQEKDELLAWTHEVKTPLTAMQLMIERLEDDQLKAQLAYEWLRIHLLLDQQLHQKRIPFIENDLYVEKFKLKPLLFKEIKNLQSWCMQKGIGFELDLQVNEILSDPKWLAFMLRQLLTNAVKYSTSSDIEIKSQLQGEQVVIMVTDHGQGIATKDLRRIFDRGFTSTLNQVNSGATGMGLYLTQKVAHALNIQLSVESELGKGTTFTLTLPQKNEFIRITGM